MPAPQQHFFFGGTYLGHAEVPFLLPRDGDNRRARNIAYYCPWCGEVWGRIVADGARIWQYTQRPCLPCAPLDVFPKYAGQLSDPTHWLGAQVQIADDWPRELLLHEFNAAYQVKDLRK